MNLSRCEKGHFFDKEKYAVCPHCQGGAGSDDSLTTVFTEDMTTPSPVPVPQEPVNQWGQAPVMPADEERRLNSQQYLMRMIIMSSRQFR